MTEFLHLFFLPQSFSENPDAVLLVVQYQFALELPFGIRMRMHLCCENLKFFDGIFSQFQIWN